MDGWMNDCSTWAETETEKKERKKERQKEKYLLLDKGSLETRADPLTFDLVNVIHLTSLQLHN